MFGSVKSGQSKASKELSKISSSHQQQVIPPNSPQSDIKVSESIDFSKFASVPSPKSSSS